MFTKRIKLIKIIIINLTNQNHLHLCNKIKILFKTIKFIIIIFHSHQNIYLIKQLHSIMQAEM